jgi:hypothetical protein
MAVVDNYADALTEAGKRTLTYFTGRGDGAVHARALVEVAAADDNGSTYRLFDSVPVFYRIESIKIYNDAITAGTDYDLGFYNVANGTVIDADILLNGGDLSSAHAVGSELVGTSALDLPDYVKPIWQILGFADKFESPAHVDLVLTANTVGTAAGTILVDAVFIPVNG